jgi:tetratricopeptide (TPR) repeat protein
MRWIRQVAVLILCGLPFGPALAADPPQADLAAQAFDRGMADTKAGKFETAIKEFDEAIRLNPNYPQAYNARGHAYEEGLHQDARAVADYDQAVTLDPMLAEARLNRARIRGRQGAYVEATSDLDRAIKLKPDMEEAYKERGFNYFRMKSFQLALQDVEQAIKLKPDDPDAFGDRADIRHAMGEDRLAFEDYERALILKPDFAELFGDRGRVYNELKRYERAVQDFDQAIKLKPDLASSYLDRAVAYTKLGKFDLAIADYGQVMKLRPTFVVALKNRAAIYRDLGQPRLALADLNQALEVNPRFADALRDRARLFKENNQPGQAAADFSRARDVYNIAVSTHPDDLALLTARADAAFEAKRWSDTVSDYSKVIEHDPKMALAYVRRAEAYSHAVELNAGLADTEAALKLDRRDRTARYLRAYFNRALGNYEAAAKEYGDLVGDEDDGTAYFNQAVTYFCMARYAEAEADFRKYLDMHRNEGWALNWLHIVRIKRGLSDDPVFVALPFSPLDRLTVYEIANLFRGKTRFEEVLSRITANRSDPARQANWFCSSGFFLGEYKLEHGDPTGARSYLKEAGSWDCVDGAVAAADAELKRLPPN